MSAPHPLSPSRWTLVAPIKPTIGERAWFDSLRSRYPFPLEWFDRSWLDLQMANHSTIQRYFLADGYKEAIDALRELEREQALLAGGVPDLAERLSVLRARMDEVDPYYRLDASIVGDTITIAVAPRYKGAERDRPIVIRAQFSFPTTPEGSEAARRLKAALDYGEEAAIDADFIERFEFDSPFTPAGEISPTKVIVGPANAESVSLGARLALVSPQGATLGVIPLRFSERRLARRGGTLTGTDVSSMVSVELRFDMDGTAKLNLGFSLPGQALPSAVLPALRVLQHMHAPNVARVEIEGLSLGEPMPLPEAHLVDVPLIDILEQLERVQSFSRNFFPIPDNFSHRDLGWIRRGARLVTGERVSVGNGVIKTGLLLKDARRFAEMIRDTEKFAWAFRLTNYSVPIADMEVELGPAMLYLRSAALRNRADILRSVEESKVESVSIELEPADDCEAEVQLGFEEDENWPM